MSARPVVAAAEQGTPGDAHEPGRQGDANEPLQAGRVGRPHGLDGSFYVTGARPRLLALGGEVVLAGVRLAIVRRAGMDKRPIVRLEGIGDRPGVEALRGQPLLVARETLPPLGAGEWWAHELEGCEVYDGERPVGVVAQLLELPSCEALRVVRAGAGEAGGDAGELLVPMVSAAIRRVDVAARRIEVDLAFLGETAEAEGMQRRGGGEAGETET